MGRKRLAIIIALVTIIGGIPVVGAEHLSAGYEDAVGVQAEEDPGNRSVDTDAFDRGTQRENCFEADGSDTDPGQLEEAASSDPFCGKLIYHQGEELEQVSPPDQDLRQTAELEVGTFDVRTTRAYMTAHEGRLIRNDAGAIVPVLGVACQPFCEDNPAGTGDLVWDTTHDVGSQAGLTQEPDRASENQHDNRLQLYGADVHTLTARDVLQEAGTHEMDGWYVPGPTRSFVAFLEDKGGDPIDEERLESAVGALRQSGALNDRAVASVCGWTPDADFVGTGDAAQCEVEFEYEGPREDANDDFTDGYKDKCKSPTYVCGAAAGGAWYANFNCICNTLAVEDPFGEANVNDYIRWHWVVAPTLPECGPREPGFVVSEGELGAGEAFLAHDVDVYTNPFALQATEATRGTTAVTGTASTVAAEQSQQALSALPGLEEGGQFSPPSEVSKDDRVEPNAADAANPLADTSQSLEDPGLERSLDDPCEKLITDETTDTIDPWVDIADGEVVREVTSGTNTTASSQGIEFNVQTEPGLYNNDDPDQDDDNHPGADLYHTSGNVGLFTDKDDDGEYDTIAGDTASFSESKIDPKTIAETGAYPMIWDVRVDELENSFELNETAGCVINGNELTKGAAEAGYGPETGLFQAIYLKEPTVFVDDETGEAFPYPGGDNIYLLLSQSARKMYDSDIQTELDTQIDDTLSKLESYALDQGAEEVNVVRPGDDLELDSDYGPQCPERTGGFTQRLSFTHSCQVDCSGDTIVTRYVFQLTEDELGGGILLPVFTGGGDSYTFGAGQYTWTDVDPFDNDPSRNSDTSARPPT